MWASIIDVYKVFRDLSTTKLDELFYELELHEQVNLNLKEKSVSLIASKITSKEAQSKSRLKLESEDASELDEDDKKLTSEIMNLVRNIKKKNNKERHQEGNIQASKLKQNKQIKSRDDLLQMQQERILQIRMPQPKVVRGGEIQKIKEEGVQSHLGRVILRRIRLR